MSSHGKNKPGTSDHTPYKHWLLNAVLGQVVGVLSTRSRVVPASLPHLAIDLCAGHGHGDSMVGGQSSPEIFLKHQDFLAHRVGRDNAISVFAEREEYTCNFLRDRISALAPFSSYEVMQMDSREFVLAPEKQDQAIFLHIDPNTIATCPLTTRLIESMTPTTIMLMTLGCNPVDSSVLTHQNVSCGLISRRWSLIDYRTGTSASSLLSVAIHLNGPTWFLFLRSGSIGTCP